MTRQESKPSTAVVHSSLYKLFEFSVALKASVYNMRASEPASHASQHASHASQQASHASHASHASQQGSHASQHKITLFLT